mgnify:CR=1 FL=1|tara:strand:- start:2488 stop:4056 length:1569 start_codon:yes stop_codon:yes gene_type:complete
MNAKFKPLLLATEIRNPARFTDFLESLSVHDGKILNKETIKDVYLDLFSKGIYRPTRFETPEFKESIKEKWNSGELLTSDESEKLYRLNPQRHGQKGFDYGWCSRWKTHYFIFKRLGFIDFTYQHDLTEPSRSTDIENYERYRKNSIPITFTDIGKRFIETDNEFEKTALYINGFVKMHRSFLTKDLNKNVPLTLLLRTLKLLMEEHDKGISNDELLIWSHWKNNNEEELFESIQIFRSRYGSNPSFEQIEEYCRNEVQEGDISRDLRGSGIVDNYKRYLHLTGLFTIRGAGRYLSLSKDSNKVIDYLINNYSNFIEFNDEREYLNYLQEIDEEIVNLVISQEIFQPQRDYKLNELFEKFGKETIEYELRNIINYSDRSRNEELRTIVDWKRLEFLSSLFLFSKFPDAEVKPNYIPDDEGIISEVAPGGLGDIVVEIDNENATLYEVTTKRGTAAQHQTVTATVRHLIELKEDFPNAKAKIIAPVIHDDTLYNVDFACLHKRNDLKLGDIEALTIDEFISNA